MTLFNSLKSSACSFAVKSPWQSILISGDLKHFSRSRRLAALVLGWRRVEVLKAPPGGSVQELLVGAALSCCMGGWAAGGGAARPLRCGGSQAARDMQDLRLLWQSKGSTRSVREPLPRFCEAMGLVRKEELG